MVLGIETAVGMWRRLRRGRAQGISNEALKEAFLATFDKVVEDILGSELAQPAEVRAYLERLLRYNVPHGKLTRGMTVLMGIKCAKPELLEDQESLFRFCALGWAIELLQTSFLLADDIMDESITRRGQPCWYKLEEVQLKAVNDAMVLESLIYWIVRKYFGSTRYYVPLMELFHDMFYTTCKGQLCDMLTAPVGSVDLSKYTMERYLHIVTFKTAYYTFYLPVACAMRLININDKAAYSSAEEICSRLGEFFQVQDDYLDCYADPQVLGKVGTDIQDNKCGWLVCQALLNVNESQLKLLQENYGKDNERCIARIKELYEKLDMKAKYEEFEERTHEEIATLISLKSSKSTSKLFEWLLAKIHKRQK